MLFFWLTLHQYLTERRTELLNLNGDTSGLDETGHIGEASDLELGATKRHLIKTKVITWIQLLFVKYWIFLSSVMLLFMSCANPVVGYRIGYMILFLYFIISFQVIKTEIT